MPRYPRPQRSNERSADSKDDRSTSDGNRRSRDDRDRSSSTARKEGSPRRNDEGRKADTARQDERQGGRPREKRKPLSRPSANPPANPSGTPSERPISSPTQRDRGASVPGEAAAVDRQNVSDQPESMRINKALAGAGICSRRAADDLVAQGAVAINGETITTPGVKVTVGKDVVTVNGVTVNLGTSRQTFSYVVINKPARVVTTVNDPQGRTTVLDLLPLEMKKARLFPVGRLDFFSEGLLLLTDDGELTYRLTHPKWHLPKVYRVRIRGQVPDTALRTMRSGMTLAEGEALAPIKVNVLREENGITTLELHLIQGINRQIRRMCRDLDLTILSLKRFRHGPLDLGNLDRGKARFLDASEIAMLHRATGLA